MTTAELILIATTFIMLVSTWWRTPRWLNILPLGLFGFAPVQFIINGYTANLLSVYLTIVCLGCVSTGRLIRNKGQVDKPRGGFGLLSGILGRGLGFLALFLAVLTTLYHSLPPADLSQMTWTKAFDAMHTKISNEYAFGTWKQLDWDMLYNTYAPQIAEAETRHDAPAYYLALLGYTSSIPDGHVWLQGDDHGARASALGGGYGLNILRLDNGRVIVSFISPDGSAVKTGMEWGAELISWNGLPIETALDRTSVLFPRRRGAPATLEGLALEQCRLLVRGPVGNQVSVTFRNPGSWRLTEATLTAIYDGEMDRDENQPLSIPPVEKGVILPSGVGYIKINNEHEDEGEPVSVMEDAIQLFVENNVPGVILDVRGNQGGADELVPQFVGHFFTESTLYENVTIYFQPFNTFIRRPPQLWIEPLKPYYAGPVVVLIDNATFSSGEGIPMAIKHLPQGEVIGFYGTYGSFGMTGGVVKMPGNLTVYFPDGQSLDGQNVIQLDSDYAMQGGVTPTIRVPLTEETARAIYLDKEDVLLDFAIRFLKEVGSYSDQPSLTPGR